jgi:outer membrane lipoprotein-sorting protein
MIPSRLRNFWQSQTAKCCVIGRLAVQERSAGSQCLQRILVQVSVNAIFLRNHALRWIIPTGVAGIVALAASGVLSAEATPNLPARTAAQLLADVETAHVDGLSGTIVGKTSLGLPALPGGSSAGLIGLLSGSHTSRFWYAGPNKQRFALLDTLGETDIFHNGRDVWTYDSSKHEASHTVLPPSTHERRATPPSIPAVTPEQAAEAALKAIDPTTVVTTDSARRVADRAAYELVLSPRDTSSRIGSVRIAIDGKTKIPLGVQVYARGAGAPAIDIAFTRISFAVPDDDNFTFTPPASAHVTSGSPDRHGVSSVPDAATIGKGWTTIVKLSSSDLQQNGELGAVIGSLPEVSWTGGSGRLFESKLLTALLADDGRVYIGAVDKNVLIAAAEHDK